MKHLFIVVLFLCAAPHLAPAQAIPPGKREIELDEPVVDGVRAQSPIADAHRIQNEGGSDGAGLCVIATIVAGGDELGVPICKGGKDSALWRFAKKRPGGYSPDKLEQALDTLDHEEDWFSYLGTDINVLRTVLALGYRVGVTYSWGDQYRGRIHHMVGAENDTAGYAMVADNNRVDPPFVDHPKHTAMSQAELEARVIDGGQYWVFGWTRRPPLVLASGGLRARLAAALVVFWAGVLAALKTVLHAKSAVDAVSFTRTTYKAVRAGRGASS